MLVGLTGGIGSGKSTVAELLRGAGFVVIDADQVAREVVEPGEPALEAIVDHFGDDVVTADGRLDRAALAAVVFADADERRALEAITHPAIHAEVGRRHRQAVADDPAAIVVLDHPLLVETGRTADVDEVVVVDAPRALRRQRLVSDRGMDPADVEARMAAQADDATRRAAATHVVDNSSTLADLRARVADLAEALRDRAATSTET